MTVLIHKAQVKVAAREYHAKRQSWHPGLIMRAALKSRSQATGTLHLHLWVRALSYTHAQEAVLRYGASHSAAAAAPQQPSSPLSSQLRPQAASQEFRCLPAGTAESSWLLGSVGCPGTAPYHEKPRQPCQRATPSLTTPCLQHCRCIPVHSSTIFQQG